MYVVTYGSVYCMCVHTYTNYISSEKLSTLHPYAMCLWIHVFLCISIPVFNSIISIATKASHSDIQELVNYCQQANYSSQSAPVNKTHRHLTPPVSVRYSVRI